MQAHQQQAKQALHHQTPRVAIIGAGLSGLSCAGTLSDHDLSVTVFEKSRGTGGRMATRRSSKTFEFDHGAQYFTVRDERFRHYVESWISAGLVRRWHGRIVVLRGGIVEQEKSTVDRYVAVPSMNALCRHLALELNVKFSTRVVPLMAAQHAWQLRNVDGDDLGLFDAVVVSAPPSQSAELLQAAPQLAARAAGVAMSGCWATMVAFDEPLELPFHGAFVHDAALSWIASNSSKPGRARSPECWVLHASPTWTREFLEESPLSVAAQLLNEFWEVTGVTPRTPSHCEAHRWRFALPPEPLVDDCLIDPQRKLGACGDWCGGPRVEGAFLSGLALAGRLLDAL